jgi:hypothetical protein
MEHQTHNVKEGVIEPANINEIAWQEWQVSYAARRKETFLGILEAQRKHLAALFMKKITVLSNSGNCFIELRHRDSDPGTWIVRRWKKFLWFKRRMSSDWFNDRHQALAFAEAMRQMYEKHLDARDGKEIPRNAGS